MKVFVLEDYEERTHWFSRVFVRHEMVLCNHAGLAKDILGTIKFDVILLDHDLEGDAFVASDHPNTGYVVAKALPDTANAETPVIIHSYNAEGADLMMAALGGRARKVPFDKLDLNDLLSAGSDPARQTSMGNGHT